MDTQLKKQIPFSKTFIRIGQLSKEHRNKLQAAKTVLSQIEKIEAELSTLDVKLTDCVAQYVAENRLEITIHAYQRFRQRVSNLPNEAIERLIRTPAMYKAVLVGGDGRYEIEGTDGVAVVREMKVVTVINPSNPMERLKQLNKYLIYFINKRVNKELTGSKEKIRSFDKYREYFY